MYLYLQRTEGASGKVQTADLQNCRLYNKQNKVLLDKSTTNQLAVSQVADWSTRGLVNLPTVNFFKLRKDYNILVH